MADPTTGAPYGACIDCPATMADEAEVEAHTSATLTPTPGDPEGCVARSHTVTVTNHARSLEVQERAADVLDQHRIYRDRDHLACGWCTWKSEAGTNALRQRAEGAAHQAAELAAAGLLGAAG